jgi:hypothetical protein
VNFDQYLSRLATEKTRRFGQPGRADSQLERWLEIVQRAEAQAQAWSQRESAIMRNVKLSNEGRKDAKATLADEARKESKWLGDKRAQIVEARSRLRELVLDTARPKGADPLISFLREQEIRSAYRGRPQVDRDVAFLGAAERLDAETMRALLDVPGTGAGVSDEARRRGEASYGQRKNPEAWGRIQELDVLLDHVASVAEQLGRVLLTMGADPVAVKAALGIQTEESAHA